MCTDKHTILLYLCKQLTTVNVVATYCMTTHKEIAPCLMQVCYKVKNTMESQCFLPYCNLIKWLSTATKYLVTTLK